MKKKIYIYEDVSDSGTDFLRRALGTVWNKVTGSGVPSTGASPHGLFEKRYDSTYEKNTNLVVPEDEITDMRSISVLPADINSPEDKYRVLKTLEINPARIVKINDSAAIPNFKIPVRIYADPDYAKSDSMWQRIFMGGTSGETVYPKLADQESVFYDLAFEFETHDLWREANAFSELGFYGSMIPGNDGYAKIMPEYNNYDKYIDNYQKWAEDKHELLLPNLNFEINYRVDKLDYPTLASIDSDPLAPYPSPMWKLRNVRHAETPYINLLNYHFPVELGAEESYFSEEAIDNRWYGESWIYNWEATTELKENIKRQQKNVMFDSAYFKNKSTYQSQLDDSLYEANSPNMFNITIEFSRHYDMFVPGYYSSQRRLGGSPHRQKAANWKFRDSIETRGFDSKFLEVLKDLDEGLLGDLKMEKMSFKSQTNTGLVTPYEHTMVIGPGTFLDWLSSIGHSLDINKSGYAIRKSTDNIKLESFNYLDFLLHAYNNPDQAINDNYFFVGSTHTGRHASTYKDNLMDRYANNSDLLSVIDDTVRELQVYFRQLLLRADLDPETGGGYAEVQEHVYENLLNARTNWTEVLAYKIEKHGGDATGDSRTQNNIQNFWIFNSKDTPTRIKIADTQVKYGKDYTYKAYAYVAVISHKYKYTDFRLTKQTNNYDDDSDGNIDKYCIQFYEPLSKQIAPQIFAISSAPEKNPSGEEYSNLSEYNTYAPSQYDISESPQLADFYLNVEPCIKIIKIPIFEKKLAVLDAPDSKISNIPFHVINDDNKVGFSVTKDSFKADIFPSVVTPADAILKERYLNSQELYETNPIPKYAEAPARHLEIFRSKKKPTSYTDFKNNLVSRIDLKIPDSVYTKTDYVFFDKISPNKKYYYLMRTVTENGMPGHPSTIIEAELVSDGGYKYARFNTVNTKDFISSDFDKKTTSFKKLFQIEPNVEQLFLDTSGADFTKNASTQMNEVRIGRSSSPLWDKKFKIRLTSKKTGKKTDLNVTFNIQEKDFS